MQMDRQRNLSSCLEYVQQTAMFVTETVCIFVGPSLTSYTILFLFTLTFNVLINTRIALE